MTTTLSRCLPPMVAAKLAEKAPIRRARKIQSKEWATDLRVFSAAACAFMNTSETRLSASVELTPVLAAINCER